MSSSAEVLDLVALKRDYGQFQEPFFLVPQCWKSYKSKQTLQWHCVRFEEANADSVPDDEAGLYIFSLRPRVAGYDASYLLYIGKTDRNFRVRYREYLKEKRKIKRPRIAVMLTQWDGYLEFCYAPLPKGCDVRAEEISLSNAFVPPFNDSYTGKVAQVKRAFQ